MLTKLRYCDIFDITSTSGALAYQQFRWNSTFDPDYSNTGHQPLYRDTFASIYNQYAVVRATAKITITNPGGYTWVITCGTDDDTGATSTVDTLMEQSHSKSVILTPLTGSKSTHTFNLNWDCGTYLNIDPFSSEAYKTAVGSNPTEVSFLNIGIQPTTVVTSLVNMKIELVQHVLWTELQTPSQS